MPGEPSVATARQRALGWLEHPALRVLVALALLATHLGLIGAAGQRFKLPFNRAPADAPAFQPADASFGSGAPRSWNRMLVSRWDSQYYIGTAIRGYSLCPPEDLRGKPLKALMGRCAFHFYPGYSVLGLPLVKAGLAADHALFGVSLVASFLLLYLWTGATLRERLGTGQTYLSLLLFNAYTTGFTLVTVQTEPVTLLCGLGAFLLFSRRQLVLAALVAGAAGTFRVTGSTVGLALCVGLVGLALAGGTEPPWRRWLKCGLIGLLAGWGQLAVFAYFWLRYGDPLLYVHSHAEAFSHGVSLLQTLWPDPRTFNRALSLGPREGLFMVFTGLFLGLGLAATLRRFTGPERWFWVGLLVFTLGVSLMGSAGLAYAGMNRYTLLALPVFFSMAAVLGKKPVALGIWLAFSAWHYWHADLCTYVGDRGSERHCGIFWM